MGLDMYLIRKIYLGLNYEHNQERNKDVVINVDGVDRDKVTYIIEEAITWRKANAIQKWFVDNVQDGKDDCREYYVSKKQLKELYDTIKVIKTKKDVDKLPTTSGFFFGSTEYDEWYFKDLKRTAKELKKILNRKDDNGEYYYQSSW